MGVPGVGIEFVAAPPSQVYKRAVSLVALVMGSAANLFGDEGITGDLVDHQGHVLVYLTMTVRAAS